MRRVLLAGLVYFVAVFAVGFVLGVIRTLWLVPYMGERNAELLEMPFMLVICLGIACDLRRHFDLSIRSWLFAGGLALLMLLSVEFAVVLELRGLSLEKYVASRDSLSLITYLISMLLFALFPALLAWRAKRRVMSENVKHE